MIRPDRLERASVWLQVPPGEQAVLVASDPARFFVPPYVGAKGWVAMWLDAARVDWDEVGELVEESYRLIAPKGLVARLPTPRPAG